MNQILVTKKLYVTPELRRKKKIYKIQFFLCIFLVCLLFSYYIYAEYDRDKSEQVSKEILEGFKSGNIGQNLNLIEQDTTIKKSDNIIVVALEDNNETQTAEIVMPTIEEVQQHQESTNSNNNVIKYVTEDNIEYEIEAFLRIPRLEIEYPVIAETSEELLKISLNKYWGPNPNEIGNYCIVGHNYKSKKMFGKLSEVVNDDIIELENLNGNIVQYVVYDRYTVEPDDTSCTSQRTNGRKEITLITCTNYGKQRLVVKAKEIQ